MDGEKTTLENQWFVNYVYGRGRDTARLVRLSIMEDLENMSVLALVRSVMNSGKLCCYREESSGRI